MSEASTSQSERQPEPIEVALWRSAEAMARESDDGLIVAVEKLKEIARLLGAGRICWEPNYPEIQRALRIAQGHE